MERQVDQQLLHSGLDRRQHMLLYEPDDPLDH